MCSRRHLLRSLLVAIGLTALSTYAGMLVCVSRFGT